MRLVFSSFEKIEKFAMGGAEDLGEELPILFQQKHQEEMELYLSLREEERNIVKQRKDILLKLKEDFKVEIKELHPELFL